MVTTIAHEINNPLETIGNILYLLRNSVANADALKYVDTAQEELKRVSEITRVTLAHQRGSASNVEPVTISKLLDNVLALQSLKTGGLTVQAQRKYRADGLVIGSQGELRQVFSNLIVNAIDALAMSGNTLILGVRAARDVLTGRNGVRVTILDNGPGISPEHRPQLFEAFYTTKGEKGTGIGLWVTKTIVVQHGGTIRMRSCVRPGRSGTCFSIFLPLERDRVAS
jgi:signal transduction histidine kinase